MTTIIEAPDIARKRLEDFADQANAGKVHYDARELKRKIWAAFAEYDAIREGRQKDICRTTAVKKPEHCPRCGSTDVKLDKPALTCVACNYVGPIKNPNQPHNRAATGR